MLSRVVPSIALLLFLSIPTVLYNPKAFFTHAALLRQSFLHCAIFPTAASRRSLGRVSVPVWLIILSDQLAILGLVSHYLTNYRNGTRAHPSAINLSPSAPQSSWTYAVLSFLSECYPPPKGRLPTRYSPVRHCPQPEGRFSFDLHVLGTPPAFVLSQDQTLQFNLWTPFICLESGWSLCFKR